MFADSTRIIEESDESNNWAGIILPSYSLWKSLNETIDVFGKLSKQYETLSAEKVAIEYVKSMKNIAELEYKVGKETVIDELMNDDTSHGMAWDDSKIVAEIQLHICETILQMLN